MILRAKFEIEHIVDRSRDGVEGPARLNTFAIEPVVFDETQHRRLVRQRVIDEVALGKRRDHEQWLARTVATAPPGRLPEIAVEDVVRQRTTLLGAVAGVA